MDFLFDEVPNKIVPFDFQTFLNCNEQFVIGRLIANQDKPFIIIKQNTEMIF